MNRSDRFLINWWLDSIPKFVQCLLLRSYNVLPFRQAIKHSQLLTIWLFLGIDHQIRPVQTIRFLTQSRRCFLSNWSIRLDAGGSIAHLLANNLIGPAPTHIKLLRDREVMIAIYSVRIGVAVYFIIINLLHLLKMVHLAILAYHALLACVFRHLLQVSLIRINCYRFFQSKILVSNSDSWYFWRIKWIDKTFGRVQLIYYLFLVRLPPPILQHFILWCSFLALVVQLGLGADWCGRGGRQNCMSFLLTFFELVRVMQMVFVVRSQYLEVVILLLACGVLGL